MWSNERFSIIRTTTWSICPSARTASSTSTSTRPGSVPAAAALPAFIDPPFFLLRKRALERSAVRRRAVGREHDLDGEREQRPQPCGDLLARHVFSEPLGDLEAPS